MHKGSCHCGAVSFEVQGDLTAPEACHCRQCRKQSGHYWAAATMPRAAVTIRGGAHLTWYQSSPTSRRGFCSTCGSFLFWEKPTQDSIDLAMGAFDTPTQTRLAAHIFVADQGDYYDIPGNAKKYPQTKNEPKTG